MPFLEYYFTCWCIFTCHLTRSCPGAVIAWEQKASSWTFRVREWNGEKESPSFTGSCHSWILKGTVFMFSFIKVKLSFSFVGQQNVSFNVCLTKCTNIRLGQGLTMCIWTRSLLAGFNRSRLGVQSNKTFLWAQPSRKKAKYKIEEDSFLALWPLDQTVFLPSCCLRQRHRPTERRRCGARLSPRCASRFVYFIFFLPPVFFCQFVDRSLIICNTFPEKQDHCPDVQDKAGLTIILKDKKIYRSQI